MDATLVALILAHVMELSALTLAYAAGQQTEKEVVAALERISTTIMLALDAREA